MTCPAALPEWIPPPESQAQAPVLVGFSGGMDSSVLLHELVDLRGAGAVRALHVDHGLHLNSPGWARHCAAVCDALGVSLTAVRVQVDHDGPLGLEGAARAARRAAFTRSLRPGEVLALAQHRDDQAETFLLRALRASGTDGLAAMRPWRTFSSGWLWRPLLATSRAALKLHAEARGLHWVDDPSNTDTDRDRNFLRLRVLPLLRERWPQADSAFARAAALSADSTDLLLVEDQRWLADVATADEGALSVPSLRALPATRRARLLRRWVAQAGRFAAETAPEVGTEADSGGLVAAGDADEVSMRPAPLPAAGLEWIERALLDPDHDTRARFAWAGWRIRRWRDALYLLRDCDDADGLGDTFDNAHATAGEVGHAGKPAMGISGDWQLDWDGRAPLSLPGGGQLLLEGAPKFDATLQVRARRGGERIRLPGRRHHHRLKHVLQSSEIPPWTRARLPLLFASDGELLAAGDVAVSATLTAWLNAHEAHLRWRRM